MRCKDLSDTLAGRGIVHSRQEDCLVYLRRAMVDEIQWMGGQYAMRSERG
jgi:hypothetical protein